MKKVIFLMLSIFMLSSCTMEDDGMLDNENYIGEWYWQGTSGGLNNHIYVTPESIGKAWVLKINRDKTYTISLDNHSEMIESTYKIVIMKSIQSGNKEPYIMFDLPSDINVQFVTKGIISVKDNKTTLNISDNNYDGIGSWFRKVNF